MKVHICLYRPIALYYCPEYAILCECQCTSLVKNVQILKVKNILPSNLFCEKSELRKVSSEPVSVVKAKNKIDFFASHEAANNRRAPFHDLHFKFCLLSFCENMIFQHEQLLRALVLLFFFLLVDFRLQKQKQKFLEN